MTNTPPIHIHSLPLKRFCEIFGYEPATIRKRISRAQWAEGVQYAKDGLGQIHILMSGYYQWAESGTQASRHGAARSA